ncbi:Fic family protein [Propionibacterium australiense]|uniref:Fic family protein n=1 Tax=Propionibacterium australiense TaxID=119981 RepID=UPI0035BE1344
MHAGLLLDEGRLRGALRAPFLGFGDYEAHPTLPGKAAKLISAVAAAHAYTDGNKRLAWHLGVAFCRRMGSWSSPGRKMLQTPSCGPSRMRGRKWTSRNGSLSTPR